MLGGLERLFWWLLVVRRPTSARDYAGLLSLPLLVVIGSVALAWPWISEDAPRTMAAGLNVVEAAIGRWLQQIAATLSAPS